MRVGVRLEKKPWRSLELAGVEIIDENGGGPDVRLRSRQLANQPPIRANAVGTKVPAPCLHKEPDGGSYERFL
jgi:hypothetical protein